MERTSLETPETPPPSLAAGLRKRPAVSPTPAQPPRAIRKEFWTSGIQEGPIYKCSPWKFYEPFLKIGTEDTLVLCNDRTEIRVLRSYSKMADHITPFRQIRHVNSVHIYELYSFEDKTYGVLEYMDLSLTDLLSYVNYLTEPEIAYIIGQVSTPPPSPLCSALRCQVLAAIRFTTSRNIMDADVLGDVWISRGGEVKIGKPLLQENPLTDQPL
jgi:hypothetical protein